LAILTSNDRCKRDLAEQIRFKRIGDDLFSGDARYDVRRERRFGSIGSIGRKRDGKRRKRFGFVERKL
jgi:hypothetical protein